MIANPTFFSNPHDKNKVMELFCFYCMVDINVPFSYMDKQCPNKAGFVYGLLKYYSDLEFSGQENVFYSKFMYRGSLMKLLMLAWESNADFKSLTLEVARKNKQMFADFLGHVLTDLNYCVEEGF